MTLNNRQLQAASNICQDIAQLSLASIALPYILTGANGNLAIIGFAITIAFWTESLLLLNRTL